MALQIQITGPVIMPAGEQHHNKMVNAEFQLKCWKEGDDPETATPVIDKKFSGQQKTQTDDGKTVDELAFRVEEKIAKQIKQLINAYEYAKNIEAKPRVTKMAVNIKAMVEG